MLYAYSSELFLRYKKYIWLVHHLQELLQKGTLNKIPQHTTLKKSIQKHPKTIIVYNFLKLDHNFNLSWTVNRLWRSVDYYNIYLRKTIIFTSCLLSWPSTHSESKHFHAEYPSNDKHDTIIFQLPFLQVY